MTPEEVTLPSTQVIVPVLDMKVLQEKANEYAMKGAIESIKDYYTGYSSPFVNKIKEELNKQDLHWNMQLPDILSLINDSLVKEMDVVANSAVLHTYVPMVKKFLTRVDGEITFSEILKEFIEAVNPDDPDDCTCDVSENKDHDWLNVTIEHEKRTYELTLHLDRDSSKAGIKKYCILSLPYNSWKDTRKGNMIFSMDNTKLEFPFERDIIRDDFMSYIAKVVMCQSLITMDVTDFDEGMFPERCHCD